MGTLSIGTLKILTPFSWLWRHFRRTPQKESSSEPIAGDIVEDESLHYCTTQVRSVYYRTLESYNYAVQERRILKGDGIIVGEYNTVDGQLFTLCSDGVQLVYRPFEEEE